uniref:Ig-like domain-containing protein n=1 Tax=Peronospora matthiolae TaxID=2874970 RepID=A0AAV1USG8_9STRA
MCLVRTFLTQFLSVQLEGISVQFDSVQTGRVTCTITGVAPGEPGENSVDSKIAWIQNQCGNAEPLCLITTPACTVYAYHG